MQDAFTHLINSDVTKIGDVRAFLYRIANNLIIDHARRNRVRDINGDQDLPSPVAS
ncbi:RNA polymerase sigma factor [Pseudomonas yamanorum]|jgi:RNA polymerase sigma-70 factor (ECF subfamily)|uniref:RNA polymerase sigma factor n=1 Tax=Pseudomonas yamanorum TaxID=515393 RepID=UPI003BA3B6CC